MTLRPTPPRPNTATVEPRFTFAEFRTAPMPVVMPQPSKQTFSSGAFLLIFASAISGSTVYSENVDVPMKCRICLPFFEKRLEPSGIKPLPWVARIATQRLVLPDLQNLHSPHSGVYSGIT